MINYAGPPRNRHVPPPAPEPEQAWVLWGPTYSGFMANIGSEEKFDKLDGGIDLWVYLLATKILMTEEILQKVKPDRIVPDLGAYLNPMLVMEYIYPDKEQLPLIEAVVRGVGQVVLAEMSDGGESPNISEIVNRFSTILSERYPEGMKEGDKPKLEMAIRFYALGSAIQAGFGYQLDVAVKCFDGAPVAHAQKWYDVIDEIADRVDMPKSAQVKLALQKTMRELPQIELGEGHS